MTALDRFLGFGSDACAVLDRRGTIVAVNDVWSDRAVARGAAETAGVHADYLEVCRRAAAAGAPQAALAVDVLSGLLDAGAGSSSFLYPCTVPDGVRWFRADVLAVGATGHVGVRHVDVSADRCAGAGHDGILFDSRSVLLTEAGLRIALADALDGPPRPAVLLMVTDLPPIEASDAALVIATAVAGQVDTAARLDHRTLALLVTAADVAAAMATADTVVHTVARGTGRDSTRWAMAQATPGDDPDTLLARARRSLLRAAEHPRDPDDAADRSARLHRAALALTSAVDDFDRAIARGVDMAHLRELDRLVEYAEQGVVDAATVLAQRTSAG